LLGAIAGDIIGSRFEWHPHKSTDFKLLHKDCIFTDDTVLTIAVADALLSTNGYGQAIWDYGNRFPGRGYGSAFAYWLQSEDKKPYNSYGNGSAMRVSPVGWAFNSAEEVLEQAKSSAQVTHNHIEGIKGAQATALAILMARQGEKKEIIQEELSRRFGYSLDKTLDDIRPGYTFDVTCQGSVPEAIIAFLESTDFESAVRNAISLGGDADTQAAITGSIAEAYYGGIPEEIVVFVRLKIPEEFWQIIEEFNYRFIQKR